MQNSMAKYGSVKHWFYRAYGKTAIADMQKKVKISTSVLLPWKKLAQKKSKADMEFVQNFTPPDFQAKNFTP